jgi:hypothetical protein
LQPRVRELVQDGFWKQKGLGVALTCIAEEPCRVRGGASLGDDSPEF